MARCWSAQRAHAPFPLALGVLQVLALDIGTDALPAVALGAEPPARHLLDRPPVSGRLLDPQVLCRAFGLLGPVMSAMSMLAFIGTFVASGWRPPDAFWTGPVLLAASGSAYLAVVFGQMANAFACRSSTVWPGALGWMTNRLLPMAVAGGLLISLATVVVPPIAAMLGQAPPIAIGWTIALLTAPTILLVDWIDKAARRRWLSRHSSSG
ncbi:MAG: cation transporting ATPase C-terminal domain-containing protein [Actinomycetales bacterium]|jgi:magnesium-transporting ATPase (P-type)